MISLNPKHLKRYKDLAGLLVKHGRADWLHESGLGDLVAEGAGASEQREAGEELAADLEELGPTYIKLGQVLSSRADLLPPTYLEALSRLKDGVEPFPFEKVEEIVQEELGVRISKAFEEFEERPLGSASLGQVHRAKLRSGRDVAVKVQRPEIRQQIIDDLEAFAEIAEVLDERTEIGKTMSFTILVEEFRRSLLRELDYHAEADSLVTLKKNLEEFEHIWVPAPIPDYSSARVLTMEYVEGATIDTLSPVILADIDGSTVVDELFRAYLKQILVDGFFHADPHAGNLIITPDHNLAILDLGMVGSVAAPLRLPLLKLLMAVADGDGDGAARVVIDIAEKKRSFFNELSFCRDLSELILQHQQKSLEKVSIGRMVLEVCRIAARSGLRLPPALSLLGKALLSLDEVARRLAPEFQPTEAVRRHVAELLQKQLKGDTSLSSLIEPLLDAKELAAVLPGRIKQLLDLAAENKIKVGVKPERLDDILIALQKIANRIASGLVLAALIVGASLLMKVETRLQLFGYPALAVICFALAFSGGLVLLWQIVKEDRTLRGDGD